VAILNLKLLEAAVVVADCVAVLVLPLLGDLLLLDHHVICALFVALVPLLRFEKLVFQVGYFDVALVVELVYSAMKDDFHAV